MNTRPDLSRFTGVTVEPVFEDREQEFCVPVPDAPHTASFWTVYGELRAGGIEPLIDCADERSARIAAFAVERALYAETVIGCAKARGGLS